MSRRVVVTGMGAISPIGNDVPTMWKNMVDGVDTFIEVGVGKTLTGLVKRINGDVKAFKVETAADIDALEL